MLKNYFLVAIRNLYRNKYYALINIVGLGMAMALCVVGYVNYRFSQSFNSGHKNADRIYALTSFVDNDGRRQDVVQVPTPLAPAVATDVPGVERYCRLAADIGDVRGGDAVFREGLYFVDPGFFSMFTFEVRQGTLEGFGVNPLSAVITDDVARKFFADSSALGRQLSITMSNGKLVDFEVRSVIAEPPLNSSFFGGVYLAYAFQKDIFSYDFESWTDWTSAAFLMLDGTTTPDRVSAALSNYLGHTNEANPESGRDGFFLTPLSDLPQLVSNAGGPLRESLHPAAIMAPSVVAFLILLLACFNFMNTSIAFAARRVREIGVRKVAGSMRGQLVGQFLGENLLLCLVSLLVATALAEIAVPAYGSLWPDLDLSFSYTDSPGLIAFLLGMLLFTGVAAGLYPALYVSRFSPSTILRGSQKLGGTSKMIRVLLTAQLALSMTSIVSAAILTRNASYIRDFDFGYDVSNSLAVPIENARQYNAIRSALASQPDVEIVGATESLIARRWSQFSILVEGREMEVHSYQVGDNYCDALRLDVVEGRSFDTSLVSDGSEAILVNKTLVRQAGWGDALGKSVAIQVGDTTRDYRVIGVVRDFYPGFGRPLRPAIIRMTSPDNYRYAIIRATPGSRERVSAYLEDFWRQNSPNLAYAGLWMDWRGQQAYDLNENIRLVFLYVAAIAIVISSMGLLALVSLNIARRTREIGIRKALGASVANISTLVTREFLILILIGSVLAVGLGYYLTDMLLSSMWTYYCDFGVTPFAVSILMVLVVAALSVGYRVWTAARANPVDALRYE